MILYPQKAPATVSNFIELVTAGFYNGIYFHRVVPGFVIQAGDPRGDGWGGPGYSIPCEYNDIFYERGVVGMAHAGKDTGGSQFFITHTPQPHLNGRHTAFGRVVSGLEVIDRIEIYDQIIRAEIVN
jgi:peptidyl-prolyl cis-trans isomerase B (cyclophilin B)